MNEQIVPQSCKCGCGGSVGLAKTTDKRKGTVKGEPLNYIRGHANKTHSHGGTNRTPTYRSWAAMKNRCNNPNAKDYKYYGARGIKVCERWKVFTNFLSDMGERPAGLTIERKDSNGPYEPNNCVWATQLVQVNNCSHNHMIQAFGKRQSICDWARETGIPKTALSMRIHRGWPVEEALTSPIRPGLARIHR